MYIIGGAALLFILTGVYLHLIRKKSENVFPAPFLNPTGKRKPKGR
jgi:hypothetical protein